MKLYEPREMTEKTEPPKWAKKLGMGLGIILGAATGAAMETTIVWAIATVLVGLPFTWLQIFGCLLIFNGLAARFNLAAKSDK